MGTHSNHHITILHHILPLLIILITLGSLIESILEHCLAICDNIKLDSNVKVKLYPSALNFPILQGSQTTSTPEISHEHSKRWVESKLILIISDIYTFILILISWNLYSYSKCEILIIFILYIQHVWFCWFRCYITQHLHELQNKYEH